MRVGLDSTKWPIGTQMDNNLRIERWKFVLKQEILKVEIGLSAFECFINW